MGKSNISDIFTITSDGKVVGNSKLMWKNATGCKESLAKMCSIFGQDNAPVFELEKMLSLFKENVIKQDDILETTIDNYCTWLRNLNKACDGKLILWILDALLVSKDPKEIMGFVDKHFDDFVGSYDPGNDGGSWNVSNIRSALRKFVKFIIVQIK